MTDLLRAFGRALAGLLHPRILWLTVWPFVLAGAGWGLLLWGGWDWSIGTARTVLDATSLTGLAQRALGSVGGSGLHLVLAPMLVALVAIPLIVVTALLLSAALSMPAVIKHVTVRYYAGLQRREGGSVWGSAWQSLWATLIFLVLMVLTTPLWLIPPLFAVLPPLLWGWLTYRVMSYDALALHADVEERAMLMRAHRIPLLAIGVLTGLLGALPTVIWVSSALVIVLFPLVAIVTIWLYILIFVFSALWFAHYCLHALQRMRAEEPAELRPALRR